jgi:hypothetical protein
VSTCCSLSVPTDDNDGEKTLQIFALQLLVDDNVLKNCTKFRKEDIRNDVLSRHGRSK